MDHVELQNLGVPIPTTKGVNFLSEAVSELIRDPKWLENGGTSDIILGS